MVQVTCCFPLSKKRGQREDGGGGGGGTGEAETLKRPTNGACGHGLPCSTGASS